jgi:tRNA threonylcarbamoyladenosine biosynthesis protein TsaE
MSDRQARVQAANPEETCHIARRLAPSLGPGDVILLRGDLGAGKTHFARCLIQNLQDRPEDVPSPTYTLIQTYAGRTGEIVHADLYRLGDPGELFELGLSEAFTQAICLVEWPERLGPDAPNSALVIDFQTTPAPEARLLTFSWVDPGWDRRIAEVTHA